MKIMNLTNAELHLVTGGQSSGSSGSGTSSGSGGNTAPETTTNGDVTVISCPEGSQLVTVQGDDKMIVTCVSTKSEG